MTDEFSKFKYPIAPRLLEGSSRPHVGPGIGDYNAKYAETVGEQSDAWWANAARETLYWDRPFTTVRSGSFQDGDVVWFPEGGLNASYNCVDRWAFKHPDKTAIIYEADEPGESRSISYGELYREVNRLANVLTSFGVRKGDVVSIYLPMTWHAAVAFFACARIGAIHSVVFAGFSAEALRERIKDCGSRVVITADEGKRGGRTIATKAIVDAALEGIDGVVEKVLVVERTGAKVHWKEGRDVWWHDVADKVSSYCPPVVMFAEEPLFILYTSGSTGQPKGVVHTTGGYLLCAALTLKYVFDVHPEDVFACMADIGWITGHTYIVYGPLANGITTVIFESTPIYPTPSRYWETVAKHRITQFYSAPTAIRLLRRLGAQHVAQYDLSSLRVLGSVGESINPEAWLWYHEVVGRNKCAVVDTYWQTETGSIVIAPLPGAVETKPGAATVPFFGIEVAILDAESGREIDEPGVEGVLVIKRPWPSIARTVYGDHKRYMDTYMRPHPGYYFTGDSASRDEDGYIWIKGRVDDVINISGHRLSTSEIESALLLHSGIAETAVVGRADEMTGQAVHAFVTLKPEFDFDGDEAALVKELTLQVRKHIGPFASPRRVYIVNDLPKTRSGKIMRRVLRRIVAGEADQIGDLSSLADPGIVDQIKAKLQ